MFKALVRLTLALSFLCFFGNYNSFGQFSPVQSGNKGKFALGGDFSIQFFNDIFLLNVSPKLGYNYSDRLMFGPGVVYQYYRNSQFEPELTTNIYGASGFARYLINQNIAAYTEYQQLFYSFKTEGVSVSEQVPVWFVGGQFFFNTGGSFTFSASILIDLIEDEFSPYGNPYYGLGGFYNF